VQGQKHLLRSRGTDQGAGRQMGFWTESRPAIRMIRKMINVQASETILLDRGCPPFAEGAAAAVGKGGAD
jgi:hypothetical protein